MLNVAGARNGSLIMFRDVWIQEDARKNLTRICIYISLYNPTYWPCFRIPSFIQHFREPPLRNDRIWGSWEDDEAKSKEVNKVYWYECRAGTTMKY